MTRVGVIPGEALPAGSVEAREKGPMTWLRTARLELEPISLALVEAVMGGRREDTERITEASVPRT